MNRCLQPGGCIYGCMQAVRWVPVLVLAAAVVWGYYAYNFELCFNAVSNWPQRIAYIFFFHIFLILFLWSYFKTVFTDPQKVPKEFFLPREVSEELVANADNIPYGNAVLQRFVEQYDIPVRLRAYDGSIRFCEKCKCIKPDRAHHCSICGQCILKFDHHCPWVNNCVNFHNYKFFLLFLGYGFVFCIYVFFTDLPYFIEFWTSELNPSHVIARKLNIVFLLFLSGMFAISLSCLFFYHLYLTAKNRSTVESFRSPVTAAGPDKNAFNHGTGANYREVFGYNRTLWFLPLFTSIGDGVTFSRHRGAPRYSMLSTGETGALLEDGSEDSDTLLDRSDLVREQVV